MVGNGSESPKVVFFWLKFHENRMSGGVTSELHPLTLTSWVKEASPFVSMRTLGDTNGVDDFKAPLDDTNMVDNV